MPDCKPNVAAPNSNAVPSRDETSFFIDNAFLSDIELHTTIRNGHASQREVVRLEGSVLPAIAGGSIIRIQNQRQYRMRVIDPPAIAGATDRVQVHFE